MTLAMPELLKEYGNFIGGEWRPAKDGATFETHRKWADLQYILSGSEFMGVPDAAEQIYKTIARRTGGGYPRDALRMEKSPYRNRYGLWNGPTYFLSRPNFLLKRLTRPPVSTIFCLPVKKG